MTHQVFLIAHILTGSLALLAGAVAALAKKGSRAHTRSGKAFGVSMILCALSALVLSMLNFNSFLLGIGLFTLFLTGSGWLWGMRSAPHVRNQRGRYMAWFGLVAAAYMVYVALRVQVLPVVLLVFAAIMGAMAGNDALRTPAPGKHITLHGGRMGGAYIAATTALLVVNANGKLPIPDVWVWLGPTIIGSPLIAIAIAKWHARSKKKTAV
jgi:uncharacterized membrane protein